MKRKMNKAAREKWEGLKPLFAQIDLILKDPNKLMIVDGEAWHDAERTSINDELMEFYIKSTNGSYYGIFSLYEFPEDYTLDEIIVRIRSMIKVYTRTEIEW